MSDTQSGIPAGWYRDPQGMTRWYDGTAWTEHTQPVHWVMPQTGQTVRTTRGDAGGDGLFVEPMGRAEVSPHEAPHAAPVGAPVEAAPGEGSDAVDPRSAALRGLVIAAVVLMAAIVVVLAVLFAQL